MREILFRGKRIDNGEFVEGDLLHSYFENGDTCICCPNWTNIKQITPETVGQFTGLTDKNGVKIFEGDVVISFSGIKYAIKYDAPNFVITPEGWVTRYLMSDCGLSYEVIGNIYDNLELLEEER